MPYDISTFYNSNFISASSLLFCSKPRQSRLQVEIGRVKLKTDEKNRILKPNLENVFWIREVYEKVFNHFV